MPEIERSSKAPLTLIISVSAGTDLLVVTSEPSFSFSAHAILIRFYAAGILSAASATPNCSD